MAFEPKLIKCFLIETKKTVFILKNIKKKYREKFDREAVALGTVRLAALLEQHFSVQN